jgi:hypothetical protein
MRDVSIDLWLADMSAEPAAVMSGSAEVSAGAVLAVKPDD